MDKTKRKRSRPETPRRSRKRSGLSSGRTPGSGESKVVWKDSPVDKQIKVSGTGKMAVRREMQGFVGRLARASQQSPPSTQEEAKHKTQGARGKRKATNLSLEENATSRLLMFSPGKQSRRKSTERGDSQEELFNVLDQMELKYASPEATSVKYQQDSAEDVTEEEEHMTGLTPAPSYSSTGTLSPRSLRTQDVTQLHGKVTELPEETQPSENETQPLEKEIQPSHHETPPPAKTALQTKKEEEFSPDDWGDLMTESWALLDRLESQAAPGTSQVQSQSQTEDVSSQNLALTPRPMPSCGAPTGVPRKPSPITPSAVRPLNTATTAQQLEISESYRRFLILEVDRNVDNRSLLLRLLDDQDMQLEAVLLDAWYDVTVEAGDTINIVFTEVDRSGFFSHNGDGRLLMGHSPRIMVDDKHNIVIVHPDLLVSPTSVTTSLGCLRRAVLRETLAVGQPTGQKAFLGTLKHDLFESTLTKNLRSSESLHREAKRIVSSNILGLVECGLSEDNAMIELHKVIEDFRKWVGEAMAGFGTNLNEQPSNGSKVRVSRILATEEMMWSIKWGLKGATDASVEGTMTGVERRVSHESNANGVLPVELKTGSKKYAGAEHHGQVILYTLLLSERYRQRCQEGLLIYVPPIETNRIAALASYLRGLIMARNTFASAMAKVKAIGSSTSAQVFPPMLRNRRECERCFQRHECILHHASTENGSAESSGLDELFTQMTDHLRDEDLAYFRHWNRLIDLEQQHAEKNLRALWLQVGWKRELAQESSTCIASLRLVADDPAHPESGAKRMLRFIRDQRRRSSNTPAEMSAAPAQPKSFAGVRFRVDDRVILSAESLDGKRLLVHISRATVRKIEHGLITIEARQSIPSIVTNGKSVVGNEYTWRLDKDAIMSGLRRAKENLVRLFIGTPPEAVSAGTMLSNRPELQARMSSLIESARGNGGASNDKTSGVGDSRRRNLIVHLSRPHVKPCMFAELVKQRCQKLATDDPHGIVAAQGPALLNAFSELNIDQQRAVHKILSSLDYALVLGMPGTGKTATIAFTVRVLLFLGFSVLITSYTHSAVDNLLLKLLGCNIPMLRIGNVAQVHPALAEYTLDRQAERENISSVQAMEAKMVNAQLVGCTCLSINSHVLFSKRRFDFCIVDEATQITQPIVMGPLRCADTFVLVGDHYQLPPLVANAQARKDGMDVSLFRRLTEAHPEASQQLSYQYRMNKDIMLLANRLVYGDKLKCGSFAVASNHLKLRWEHQRQNVSWPIRVLNNNQGVVFFDTDSMGGETGENRSSEQTGSRLRRRMENVVEAQVIAGMVELLVLGSVSAAEVAVISPFRSQVALVKEHLARVAACRRTGGKEWLHEVEVSTIDKYQGKDKDVILVSFVRCNQEHHVGELLTDWRRINVALTRAKQKLILVGSLSTLSGGSALFHILARVITEQRWGHKLPKDAVKALRHFAVSVAVTPAEPDPEQSSTPGPKVRRTTPNNHVQVSILNRATATHNGDIESLVPSVSTIPLRGSHSRLTQPITRDIFGKR